jgi:hypothetical protein
VQNAAAPFALNLLIGCAMQTPNVLPGAVDTTRADRIGFITVRLFFRQ